MTVLVIFLLLVIGALSVSLLGRVSRADQEYPLDPEHLQRAAVELHRIRRRREGAELRQGQRQEAMRAKREIAEALEDDRK